MKNDRSTVGWILYDGSCGFCRKAIPLWQRTLAKRGIETVPLQETWVQEKSGLSEEFLMQEMALLMADGAVHLGADAYRQVMRRIWWAVPVYWFSLLPGIRQLFDFAYRTFARNRRRISGACRLEG
ncbi:MAG: DUF393 domain-containing protein [Verrucomicrobiota bacterium]